MFRQTCTAALLAVVTLGSLAFTIAVARCGEDTPASRPEDTTPPPPLAEQAHPPASKPENTIPKPPLANHKELVVDLGGGVKLEMVLIPAGEFLMGSPDSDKDAFDYEKPRHRVRITKPFYLGKYLVTQEQWQAVMGNNPSYFAGRRKNPVEQVSWDDCQKFLGKLNGKFGEGRGRFQLPTEAQWEYACRAGSRTRFCFGDGEDNLGEYAWFGNNSGIEGTHPVGKKKPNAWGLYDIHGNVWGGARTGIMSGTMRSRRRTILLDPQRATAACSAAVAGASRRVSVGRPTATGSSTTLASTYWASAFP